jgi:hypothetical protein
VSLDRASGALWPGHCGKARPAGRKPGLSDAELRRIVRSLQRCPEVLGFDTRLWSAQAVADLVTNEYRVKSTQLCSTNPGSAGLDLVAASSGWSQQQAQTEWQTAMFFDENQARVRVNGARGHREGTHQGGNIMATRGGCRRWSRWLGGISSIQDFLAPPRARGSLTFSNVAAATTVEAAGEIERITGAPQPDSNGFSDGPKWKLELDGASC